MTDIDVLEPFMRLARMRAARADPHRPTHPAIAAMQAGAGAELVASAERVRMMREIWDARRAARERASQGTPR